MAPTENNIFKDGIWIRNWKFPTDQPPFKSNMSAATILKTRHGIEKFVFSRLNSQSAWKKIGKKLTFLIFAPRWVAKHKKGSKAMDLVLSVTIRDPKKGPDKSVVAPPPPQQPPPPTTLH